ncbi:MAG: hypothetical protein LBR99_04745 [Treponema sp.]|nr:hypothetical protein [Treponema sp.]
MCRTHESRQLNFCIALPVEMKNQESTPTEHNAGISAAIFIVGGGAGGAGGGGGGGGDAAKGTA